jgi:hypothetical protein
VQLSFQVCTNFETIRIEFSKPRIVRLLDCKWLMLEMHDGVDLLGSVVVKITFIIFSMTTPLTLKNYFLPYEHSALEFRGSINADDMTSIKKVQRNLYKHGDLLACTASVI